MGPQKPLFPVFHVEFEIRNLSGSGIGNFLEIVYLSSCSSEFLNIFLRSQRHQSISCLNPLGSIEVEEQLAAAFLDGDDDHFEAGPNLGLAQGLTPELRTVGNRSLTRSELQMLTVGCQFHQFYEGGVQD